jgi:thiamine biosynthesis lipoprotein
MTRRARPLLGTLVAIACDAGETAVDRAFAAIERVQTLMNFHSRLGDLARLNAAPPRTAVRVDPWTYRVLRFASGVARASGGAFDVTLPGAPGRHRDIELLGMNQVLFRRRTRLDLGGVAKGFAVDRAVEALRRAGARRGSVNAGGDLRRFGPQPEAIRVRLPGAPVQAVALPRVRMEAFATSAGYFGGSLHDRRAARRLQLESSITVCAPTCMAADALTKVVAIRGPDATLLRRFRARAFAVDRQGRLYAAAG